MKLYFLPATTLLLLSHALPAASSTDSETTDLTAMDHSAMRGGAKAAATLTEAGNDAFGTIQEVIAVLLADPETDWATVDLATLRRHLTDMQDMTLNIEVVSQKPVENGVVSIVRPTSERAAGALQRVFSAHPTLLEKESGWQMQVDYQDGAYTLTTTTRRPDEVDMIRGLGYIGLLALGQHHQPHHLSIAQGLNPHSGG